MDTEKDMTTLFNLFMDGWSHLCAVLGTHDDPVFQETVVTAVLELNGVSMEIGALKATDPVAAEQFGVLQGNLNSIVANQWAEKNADWFTESKAE